MVDATSSKPAAQQHAQIAAFSSLHAEVQHLQSPLRRAISDACRRNETDAVQWLLSQAADSTDDGQARQLAAGLVESVRKKRTRSSGVDALMFEFSLSSEEGVALMCLAEALLRIPDHQTADRLIADKISQGEWGKHLGESPSLFVNAATWGLVVTGKLVGTASEKGLGQALKRLIRKGGEPLIRKGVDLAMRMLGNQFVTGQTIAEALKNGRPNEERGYRYSYDMLGEAALTSEDADNYFASYEEAIHAIGRASAGRGIRNGPGISVKLSALHPRYSRAQKNRVMDELLPRLKALILLARQYDIGLNIDAEEADRLELSLDLMEALAADTDLAGFDGLGFVVQAYQKRCPYVIDYLVDLARRSGRKFMVRLVKGAYWDAEIKRAQVDGLDGYPVYTRKAHTDVSYLVCARKLLASSAFVYPQFATHNAHTVATIYQWAIDDGVSDYEFQCLHGMGEALYDQVVGVQQLDRPCRIYAPVGPHKTLLAYLVRRLLENGANSSFVNQIVDDSVPVERLIADPFSLAAAQGGLPHPGIPLPADLYGSTRKNSAGLDLSSENVLQETDAAMLRFGSARWHATPLLADGWTDPSATSHPVINPADGRDSIGSVINADRTCVEQAIAAAVADGIEWGQVTPAKRARLLSDAADLLEQHRFELMALAVREAGKSLPNAVAEIREAVDFLRYYASQVGESQQAQPRGVVACISPWNFPLAIFMGQVSAALAAGNVVLAKPAEQTPLIAFRAIQLLHEAGIPRSALQFLPGTGEEVGAALVADHRIRAVVFTGSTEVAQSINCTLAQRYKNEGQEVALIAETGGQNVMIVDSSALTEQVVQDVIASAFDSAGQRCSALRVLCLQEDIADRTIAMLKGAMNEMKVGNPDRLATDVGPVIDRAAQASLLAHIEKMRSITSDCFSVALGAECDHGTFVAPTVIQIDRLSQLEREVFGPVLHVLRYRRQDIEELVDEVNDSGFGLTLGIHSRIDETIKLIASRARVGNMYVNRNIVGAVVGVQPFGGEGKSGTGPKAGGPFYLPRLTMHAVIATEKGCATSAVASPAFLAMQAWAARADATWLSTLLTHYASASFNGASLDLAGPTGEKNTLFYAPRGTIGCVASSRESLLNQLAAVFASGNRVLITTAASAWLPADFVAMLGDAIHIEDEITETSKIDMALVDATLIGITLLRLAMHPGAIVPVVETRGAETIPIWRLVAERAICVNTTAAGGNASLMMLAV